MTKKLLNFFDKLEDRIRGHLSRFPLVYGLVSGIAVVLFWRGVWETSDLLLIHPVASFLIGLGGLLATGVLVSEFIGNRLIISGLKGEKKFEEKTLKEVIEEENQEEKMLNKIYTKLEKIESEVDQIKQDSKT